MNQVEIDLVYGLIGTFLFIFRNPDNRYVYPIAIFFIGLFISQLVFLYVGTVSGQLIWVVSAVGLLTYYGLRFNNKRKKGIIEFIKVLGIILISIYPLPFYRLISAGDSNFWITTRMLTWFVLVTIYVYDRWILKPEKMKRKYIIALVGQTILILVMLVFSVLQKAKADRSREIAEQLRIRAEENAMRALEIKTKYDELVREKAATK